VAAEPTVVAHTYRDILIVLGFALAAVLLGAATLRRKTK